MKKFKKIIAMCLTAVMAISVMSIGALAAPNNFNEPLRTGVLSNGVTYEIYAADANSPMPISLAYWQDTVTVPITNAEGTSGVILGGRNSFVPAPHNRYYVEVGNLPSVMPSVNVGVRLTDGSMAPYTRLNANEYAVFTIPSGLIYDNWVATASPAELHSRSATFTCYTF